MTAKLKVDGSIVHAGTDLFAFRFIDSARNFVVTTASSLESYCDATAAKKAGIRVARLLNLEVEWESEDAAS